MPGTWRATVSRCTAIAGLQLCAGFLLAALLLTWLIGLLVALLLAPHVAGRCFAVALLAVSHQQPRTFSCCLLAASGLLLAGPGLRLRLLVCFCSLAFLLMLRMFGAKSFLALLRFDLPKCGQRGVWEFFEHSHI